MAYQMYWHPLGLVCPHCEEVLIIRFLTVHQEIGITIHAFCSACIYLEGKRKGQNATFEHVFPYDHLFKVARELDDKQNKRVSDVDELAGYEQQMHDFETKLFPPTKEEADETD